MRCEYSEKDIALYVEGDLTEVQARDIDAHLEACGHCHELEASLRDSQAIFKSVRQETVSGAAMAEVRDRVLAEVTGVNSRTPWGRKVERWLWLGLRRGYALAGVGLVVLMGVALWYLGLETQREGVIAPAPTIVASKSNTSEITEVAQPVAPVVRRAPTRTVRPKPPVVTPADPAPEQPKQIVVKLLTDDPNIVIYWLVDKNGD